MVHDQAPERRHRRQARSPLHQGRAGDLGGGSPGWRRPGRELPAAPGHRQGALGEHALREHQAHDRQGGRWRRGRAVRGDRLRGLRPRRRGDPRRGRDRQPQPHRGRGPLDLHQGRRPAGRLRRGGLAVRAEGPDQAAVGSDPDAIALAAIDAGASDVDTSVDPIEIYTETGGPRGRPQGPRGLGHRGRPGRVGDDRQADRRARRRPARQALRLVELLEELDDVQRVTANFDIPEEVFAEVAG